MNIGDSRPVYVQLIERIYTMVLSGEYKPGDRLPTVRELAGMMQANPNTVQRALFYLEDTGLIYTQRTTGKFITEDPAVIEGELFGHVRQVRPGQVELRHPSG